MLERLKGLFEGRDCLTDAARSSALVPACRGRGISAQVTNLEYRTFAAHLEDSHAAWRQDESVRRLEAELDQEQFPTQAVLPGREVHL